MKNCQHAKFACFSIAFHRYIICSISVSGWGVRAKYITWKTDWSSNRTAAEVQHFHAVHFWRLCFCNDGITHGLRSSYCWLTEVHVLHNVHFVFKKRMKKQRLKVLLLEVLVLGLRKFKNSYERGWTKIRDRSSRWKNSGKFN